MDLAGQAHTVQRFLYIDILLVREVKYITAPSQKPIPAQEQFRQPPLTIHFDI